MNYLKAIAPILVVAIGTIVLAGCGGGGETAKPAADAPKVEAKTPGSTNPSSSLSNPYNPQEKTTKKGTAK